MSVLARTRYRVAHWGQGGSGETLDLRCADPREVQGQLTALGSLVSVVYLTRKGTDRELVEYEHAFSKRRPPILAFTKFGPHSLVICGGEYEMQARGIVR